MSRRNCLWRNKRHVNGDVYKYKIKISKGNSKLGNIANINIPALVTCRKNAPCAKTCYARNGNYRFPSVKESHNRNLLAYLESPENYFNQIKKYLTKHTEVDYFRYHSSGDIVDYNYLKNMVKVAKEFPNVNFLAYTKKFELVNEYLSKGYRLPKNLKVLFSNWDKNFKVENPYGRPMTYVNFKDKTLNPEIPANTKSCSGNCSECKICWHLRKGQSVTFNQH